MEKVKDTFGISKGDIMSGIGVDQSALLENPKFKKSAEEAVEGRPTNPKDINTSGGPNYSRESKVPVHKSAMLNKLDPRIGFGNKEINESIAKYEAKYGKAEIGDYGEDYPGSKMSGLGTDQSALAEGADAEGHR